LEEQALTIYFSLNERDYTLNGIGKKISSITKLSNTDGNEIIDFLNNKLDEITHIFTLNRN
jgi:hypothetical protein